MRIATLISLIILSLAADIGCAQTAAQAETTPEKWQFRLTRFMPQNEPVVLTQTQGRYDLYFPVPERYVVDSASLHLEFTNSNLVLSSRSHLRISLNDRIVAQIALDPRSPHTEADIPLPRELLHNTYNKLQFWVAQHYTDKECEDPESPELWTQIDMERSSLSLTVQRDHSPLRLSDLRTLMDEKLPGYRLQVLHSGAQTDATLLQWGALVSQGAAVRLNYVPLEIGLAPMRIVEQPQDLSEAEAPLKIDTSAYTSDVVLLGTASQLRPALSQELSELIKGPFLALYPLPGKAGLYALVVSGLDDTQVLRAAQAFALMDYPLPDTAHATIHELHIPKLGLYELPDMLAAGGSYSFQDLGAHTLTTSGRDSTPLELKLVIPPDLYAPEDAQVQVRLHLAYGASMRSDSVINVHLNRIFEHAIALNQPLGAHYRDYRITIPLRSLRPGLNLLSFHPQLVPDITGKCTLIQSANLVLTLFGDSTITLPVADHYARLPDLALFGRTGFPFTARGDGSETVVVAMDRRPETMTSTWRLLSRVAQVTKMPLLEAAYAIKDTELDRNVLAVGSLDSARDNPLLDGAPILSRESSTYAYPLAIRQAREPRSVWARLLAPIMGPATAESLRSSAPRLVRTQGPLALGDQGLLMSYPSQAHEKRVVVTMLSQTPHRLAEQISGLVRPSFWPKLQGNVFSWSLDEEEAWSMDTGDGFYLGEIDPRLGLAYHFSRHPWVWIGASLLLLLVFAWVSHRALSRYKSRSHPDADEMPS